MTKRTASQLLLTETAHLPHPDRLRIASAWAWARTEAGRHPACERGPLAVALSLKLLCQDWALDAWVRDLIGKAAAEAATVPA